MPHRSIPTDPLDRIDLLVPDHDDPDTFLRLPMTFELALERLELWAELGPEEMRTPSTPVPEVTAGVVSRGEPSLKNSEHLVLPGEGPKSLPVEFEGLCETLERNADGAFVTWQCTLPESEQNRLAYHGHGRVPPAISGTWIMATALWDVALLTAPNDRVRELALRRMEVEAGTVLTDLSKGLWLFPDTERPPVRDIAPMMEAKDLERYLNDPSPAVRQAAIVTLSKVQQGPASTAGRSRVR